MRLRNNGRDDNVQRLQLFADWLAALGDGRLGGPNDGYSEIEIPQDLLLQTSDDPISTIVDSTYPSFTTHIGDLSYLRGRCILAPTLDIVDSINDYMVSLNPNEGKTYLSSDNPCRSEGSSDLFNDLHTPEFLNGIKCSGIPNHQLTLKVGTPVMLLRNIDHIIGLCNGTRLVVTRLGSHVLEAQILEGKNAGEKVLIPRLAISPSDSRIPFKFSRRQFPLIVSYAMTINKSQGQSLSHVGVYLRKPVFSHGQLYIALSRVTNPSGLKLLLGGDGVGPSNVTTNVVYHEVFNNV